MRSTLATAAACIALVLAACGDDGSSEEATTATTTDATTATTATTTDTTTAEPEPSSTTTFVAEVWADNWFALYANGELVGEDSVPITTERSFNAETITFEATYPLTLAVEAKDYTENETGLEYIGTDRQQMGDGGVILQVTDTSSGDVVAVTNDAWRALVIDQAPLNPECESSSDPLRDCQSSVVEAPDGWTEVDFDDSDWASATIWSEADVAPKDGYDEIAWDGSAELVWGPDLEVDNTVLLRVTIGSGAVSRA